MPPRFYSPEALPRDGNFPLHVTLGESVAAHLRALRMVTGEVVTVFDGLGGEFTGVLDSIGKRDALLMLAKHSATERESPLSITLVQSLATGDKMDWVVQKAVELGVTAIQPVSSARANLKLSSERAAKRAEHWRGVVIAACEQCGRNRLPEVHGVMEFSAWLQTPVEGTRLLLHPEGGKSLSQFAAASQPLSLLIGPEGGFDDKELALAQKHGAQLATLGPRVLRTETAGLAALAVLQSAAGDLK
ncbi:MAG: 16S rRNA (uracil(1498)-N(3))-methyltransferase [Betaproteobacteria bacterium]|nr:16S rRNA (uracil(1498)-N(3))-methyltransferase [Betaproteobacteria bacterium]